MKDKEHSEIPGIYNYCDRWCERCSFTSRCATFAASSKVNLSSSDDLAKYTTENLENAVDLIYQKAKELGIDLDALDDEELLEASQQHQDVREEAIESPLAANAHRYMDMVDEWLKMKKSFFKEKEIDLNKQVKLGIKPTNSEALAFGVNDVLEVVQFYRFTIYTKLVRAITGSMEGEEQEGVPKDSDGSAKVALLSIDTSMAAWARLQTLLPELTDEMITFLLHLDRLKKAIEKTFPNARNFVRPGFDN